MNKEIKKKIEDLQPSFEKELRSSIDASIPAFEPYGYALMIGEDLDQAFPIAVTNSEKALDNGKSDEENRDLRYLPDEWQDWHYDHFKEFEKSYSELYKEFEDSHQVTDEDFCYTDDAIEFQEEIYKVYLDSLKNLASNYESIWYWVIWISDCESSILKESFLALNTGRALEEAKNYFD